MDSMHKQLPITADGNTMKSKRNGNSQIQLKAIWRSLKRQYTHGHKDQHFKRVGYMYYRLYPELLRN